MISYDMEQTSDDWFEIRRGMPTSSQFARIMTPKGMKMGAGAKTYAYELLASLAQPEIPVGNDFTTPAIEHGKEMEPEAADYYAAFHTDDRVYEVGFTTTDDGRFGGSPDRMVGDDGVLEIKCPQGATHLAWLDAGVVPAKHLAQCHGHMITTGRDYCDWLSYAPPFPELLVRVVPDDYTVRLMEVLDEWWVMFEAMKSKLTG
jgi:putative phage-type endonuclease